MAAYGRGAVYAAYGRGAVDGRKYMAGCRTRRHIGPILSLHYQNLLYQRAWRADQQKSPKSTPLTREEISEASLVVIHASGCWNAAVKHGPHAKTRSIYNAHKRSPSFLQIKNNKQVKYSSKDK